MTHLVACPSCNRHVRAREHVSCPFCNVELPALAEPRSPNVLGLGRAAVMALGAALAVAPLTACGSDDDGGGSGGTSSGGGGSGGSGGGSAGTSSGGSSGGGSGGTGGGDAGGSGGIAGGNSGGFSGLAQPYGIPPLRDPDERF
jgi:hypothetical protein